MKSALFTGMAVALPLIAVLMLEGILRIAGIGESRRRPFRTVPGRSEYVALDPDYGAMFFRGFRPGVAFDPIARARQPGTLRVVALGGSTTAGFPFHWYYGFPARLEDRLAAALPGRRIEMANLGMTATNSFTLWALAGAVVQQHPDAVVIYSGHNEFYGAYGTAGTQGWTGTSVWIKRTLIAASRWAVVAGIGSFFQPDEEAASARRTLMARVIRDASIGEDDEAYLGAIYQYESNMRSVLARFEHAGIPVFLATLTSNLKDRPPLGDEPAALAAFEKGRAGLASGDSAGARAAFLEAKEADGLRFRAPEAINDVIRRLAASFSNVTLVDVQERFHEASRGGIEGADLFTDHLHPNARGYALMAETFFDMMRPVLPDLKTVADPGPTSSEIDAIEMRFARLQVSILTDGYPFRKDRTPEESEQMVLGEVDSLARSSNYADALTATAVRHETPMANVLDDAVEQARAQEDTLAALRLYGALLHWQPLNEPLMERAVGFAARDARFDRETAELARFAATRSDAPFHLNILAAIALRGGDLSRADALLTAVEAHDARSAEMLYNRARLLVMQGDTAAARSYFERYRAVARGN